MRPNLYSPPLEICPSSSRRVSHASHGIGISLSNGKGRQDVRLRTGTVSKPDTPRTNNRENPTDLLRSRLARGLHMKTRFRTDTNPWLFAATNVVTLALASRTIAPRATRAATADPADPMRCE